MTNVVAAKVEEVVDERPWVEKLMRLGWFAKGLVYLLMGVAAWSIARAPFSSDKQASPQGVLHAVATQTGGRLLLVVLGVGLLLYALWRLATVATTRGWDLQAVLQRLGYLFSAVFYGSLAYTSIRAAQHDTKPTDPYSVEHLSSKLMGNSTGRAVLVVGGVVVIGVGVFFVVKAVTRKYADNLRGVSRSFAANTGMSKVLWVLGLVGWLARGVVTGMLGFFVTRAAWIYHPAEAHGFDAAFRDVARDPTGKKLVMAFAVGLVLYGVYCLLSAPRRKVADS
jgi:hypothetical protein